MNPKIEEIIRTVSETRNGIEYVTHYVNRPIRQGDTVTIPEGISINGKETKTKVTNYKYALTTIQS